MNRISLAMAAAVLMAAVGFGCADDVGSTMQKSSALWATTIRNEYMAGIARFDSAAAHLERVVGEMTGDSASTLAARRAFADARLAYKRIEFLSEHFFPGTARSLNGPVLDEVEEDEPNVVLAPEGLQVIEEKLHAGPAIPGDSLRDDLHALRTNITRLRLLAQANRFSDQNIFDAMMREVVRVMALGLSGFDSPIAGTSVREAAAALDGVRNGLAVYAADLNERSPAVADRLDSLFAAAIGHLESNPDFIQFDRLHFIRSYADPIYAGLHQVQEALGIPFPDDRRAISTRATSIFGAGAFDPLYFAPGYAWIAGPAHVELGRILFFDPVLSGNGRRACASCHRPEMAFTDGMARSTAFDFKGSVSRNAPTLINAGLQASSFYDARVMFLEDQAADVLSNPAEMHGSMAAAVAKLRRSPEYAALFGKAYGAGENAINDLNIRIALASYIRSLVSFNAPFDRFLRGDDAAMAEPARRGFNLFMGKAKCGTCHFMPLFNGTVPPVFSRTETEILGVTERLTWCHRSSILMSGGIRCTISRSTGMPSRRRRSGTSS